MTLNDKSDAKLMHYTPLHLDSNPLLVTGIQKVRLLGRNSYELIKLSDL